MILPWFSEFHISFPSAFQEYPITHHQTRWFMMMGVWWETSVSYKNDLVWHSQFHHVKPYHPMIYHMNPWLNQPWLKLTKTRRQGMPRPLWKNWAPNSFSKCNRAHSSTQVLKRPTKRGALMLLEQVKQHPAPPKHCLGDTFIIYLCLGYMIYVWLKQLFYVVFKSHVYIYVYIYIGYMNSWFTYRLHVGIINHQNQI